MHKLISKTKVTAKSQPWIHEASFVISSDDGLKETSVFAGIYGEDLYKYLNWSQDKNGENPTEQQLNKWRGSVIEKCLNDPKILESKVWYHSHNGNQKVLEFLESSLKG